MGIEEKLPSGVLLTTVEGVAGYMRKASFWPATFGLSCCGIELMAMIGPEVRPRALRRGGRRASARASATS